MGLFRRSDDYPKRATRLANHANGKSVTAKRLAITGGKINMWLQDAPLLEYLQERTPDQEEEQPEYMFFGPVGEPVKHYHVTGNSGISPATVAEPIHAHRVVCLITDSRIILAIPEESEDNVYGIEHDRIGSFFLEKENWMSGTFSFRMKDEAYEVPFEPSFLKSDSLHDITKFLKSKCGIPNAKKSKQVIEGTKVRNRRLSPEPKDWSFMERSGLADLPESEEQCQFAFEIGGGGLEVQENPKETDRIRRYVPSAGQPGLALITNQRCLFVVCRKKRDRVLSIPYDEIEWISITTAVDSVSTEEPPRPLLEVSDVGTKYKFPIDSRTSTDSLWNAETYLRETQELATQYEAKHSNEISSSRSHSTPHVSLQQKQDTHTLAVPDTIETAPIEYDELLRILRAMDAYSFESLIADLWQLQGWTTEVSKEGSDGGVDITAVKSDPITQKQLIQAKCYQEGSNIGNSAVQQYASLKHQVAAIDSVVIVTTSAFTKPGEDAASQLNVKLVDGEDLCEIINGLQAYNVVRWHAGSRLKDTTVQTTSNKDPSEGLAPNSTSQSSVNLDETPNRSETITSKVADEFETEFHIDPIEELRRVRELYDDRIITEEEFVTKKDELLGKI